MKDLQKVLLIDFDDTIHDTKDRDNPRNMGKPEAGAVAAVRRLKQMGYTIVIFTGRPVDKGPMYRVVKNWLDHFGIPYDDITNVKPPGYGYIIDNKAIHFDSWERVLLQIHRLENKEYRDKWAHFDD